jgi:predicted MFS family arabinose efflux permease
LPSVQGYLIAAGGLGAATATLPVRMALDHADWRGLFVGLAAALMGVAVLIRLLAPPQAAVEQRQPLRSAMVEVFRHPAFREAVVLVSIPHMVFFGIQGLWISRWLRDVAGYSEQAVSWSLYLGMGAVIVGAVAVGMFTEWAGRRGVRPVRVAAVGVALFIIVQAGFISGWQPGHAVLAVLFTLVGTITGIEYTMVAQGVPGRLTGRAATCLNLLIFLGAFAVQAGFGLVLDCWQPNAQGRYPATAYHAGFAVLMALQLPGLVWYGWRGWRRALASGKMVLHPATSSK